MNVTTFAVVWIEILHTLRAEIISIVTTFAVVWIEMGVAWYPVSGAVSPPSRWCGLKS